MDYDVKGDLAYGNKYAPSQDFIEQQGIAMKCFVLLLPEKNEFLKEVHFIDLHLAS